MTSPVFWIVLNDDDKGPIEFCKPRTHTDDAQGAGEKR